MSTEAHHKQFFHDLEALRNRQGHLEPTEIARLALKAGLNAREALREIHDRGHIRSSDVADALALFISSLCGQCKAKRVLEYVCFAPLLTARLFENGQNHQLTYIAPVQNVAETLQILFSDKSATVMRSISDTPKDAVFDAIICQPPVGHRPFGDKVADGFGGEIIRGLTPKLAENGTLYWVTGRGVLLTPRARNTFNALHDDGLYAVSAIDFPPGAFPGSMIEGVVVALKRDLADKRFVAAVRELDFAEPVASAFLAGPSRKSDPNWTWLAKEDRRTFAEFEQDRLLRELMPRGHHQMMALGTLLTSEQVLKADRPAPNEGEATTFLFIPEYARSHVTADLEEQTVKPKAVYRIAIDPEKANARYLAQLLNSPYGKLLRARVASGTTVSRISKASLLSMEIPIPDMDTQDRIARIVSDIGLLQAAFRDMHTALDQDWNALSDVAEKIDGLKAVLDIERQIADWWRELPYPLATIYRRYQVST